MVAVNEMCFDASMQQLLLRQDFKNFFLQLLKTPFMKRYKADNVKRQEFNQSIQDFFCAIQEVFNNVEEHGSLNVHVKSKEYCTIRLEYYDNAIYFFCRDFGRGLDKAQWDEIIRNNGGAAFFNPQNGAVDVGSELIGVETGTYIKLVKRLPQDEALSPAS